MPAENVSAASTPSTPATAPAIAGRTGTAARPRPGSSAKRAPTMAGTGRPARAPAATAGDLRARAAGPARKAVHAMAAVAASTSSTDDGPAGAEHQPVGADPRARFREGGGADRHPVGGDDRGGHAQGGAGDRGQPGRERGGRRRLRAGQPHRPQHAAVPPTAAEAYLATDWPTRTSAASSAASPNASRQAASYPVTFLAVSPIQMFSSSTSMSDRPVTRARSARNAGIAASPPDSRIRPLT